MAPATEGFVRVPPDSTGKMIRNLEVTILQADGTLATVEMQVVGITDPAGHLVDLRGVGSTLAAILDELREIHEHMRLHT